MSRQTLLAAMLLRLSTPPWQSQALACQSPCFRLVLCHPLVRHAETCPSRLTGPCWLTLPANQPVRPSLLPTLSCSSFVMFTRSKQMQAPRVAAHLQQLFPMLVPELPAQLSCSQALLGGFVPHQSIAPDTYPLASSGVRLLHELTATWVLSAVIRTFSLPPLSPLLHFMPASEAELPAAGAARAHPLGAGGVGPSLARFLWFVPVHTGSHNTSLVHRGP